MKKETILLGAHTSAAGGVHNALLEGKSIGATTIQLFTSNQRQWHGRTFSEEELNLWRKALVETGMQAVMSHDSYLINLGAPDPEMLEKSRKAFHEEIVRCLQLGIPYLNFHPGSALKDNPEKCLDRIAMSLLETEPLLESGTTRLLLEMTAGQGSNLGCRFEEIAHILGKVDGRVPVGVCIDTCHIFAAGYDIRTAEAWESVLQEFDRIIGLKHLYAFHINDSLKDLGSRVDRHAALGEGKIGLACFEFLMNDSRTKHLPKYLETPGGPELWEKEIRLLRKFVH